MFPHLGDSPESIGHDLPFKLEYSEYQVHYSFFPDSHPPF